MLAHTFINEFHRVKISGERVGELHMNAALAGYYRVPFALVVGDEQTCREGRDALGDVICVERIGPRGLRYQHDDYRTVYHMSWIFQLIAQGNYLRQDRL